MMELIKEDGVFWLVAVASALVALALGHLVFQHIEYKEPYVYVLLSVSAATAVTFVDWVTNEIGRLFNRG